MSTTLMWTVAVALSLGLIYLAIMFVPQAPLPGASVQVEYIDFPYFLGLINQVSQHWPPTLAGLSGVPLPYEWFVFFHMAAASNVTGVSIPVIALRLDYVPTHSCHRVSAAGARSPVHPVGVDWSGRHHHRVPAGAA